MTERLRATSPLAGAVATLVFAWLEISLSFHVPLGHRRGPGHWSVTAEQLPPRRPGRIRLVGHGLRSRCRHGAAYKAAIGSTIGAVGALLLMWIAPRVAELPDFRASAFVTSVMALVVVLMSAAGDWFFTSAVFGGFPSVVFWWIATGLDGWAPGGGAANSLAALAKPETAGAGASGGVLSTPVGWVFVSSAVSVLCGVVLGVLSRKLANVLAALIAPRVSVPLVIR